MEESMPTYKYSGKATFVNSMYNIRIEPGETISTRHILDNIDGFERISDDPPPYSDYTKDYTLTPGDIIELPHDMFEGLGSVAAFKIGDESKDGTNKAYMYIDSINNNTDNIIDDKSYVNIKFLNYRNIQKLILKADESNNGVIVVRVSFGY